MANVSEEATHERTTAPQSPYSMREVGIGFAIFAVAILVLGVLAMAV